MKFCQKHWDTLRGEVNKRGMSHLVAKGGEETARRMEADLNGTATEADFDPLMACHWMICGRAIEQLGLYLLADGEPELCPVCEIVRVHGEQGCEHGCTGAQVEERWITWPADAALEICHEKGLIQQH